MSVPRTVVVFEHGILSGAYAWSWVLARLPADVEAVAVERNGASAVDLALRRLDYRAVLGRLYARAPQLRGAADVILVGHSIGGLLIRAHANAMGARVRGLVYVDGSSTDQFDPAADIDFQFLRLQQFLLLRTGRAMVTNRTRSSDVEAIGMLPESVRADAIRRVADHRFWLNAYREARAAGSHWLNAALFPTTDPCPTVVVSSSVSAAPESIQNRFEERVLSAARTSTRLKVGNATHESVLYDEEHSRAVNRAIEWILDQQGDR